jgi:hypothetical protein
MLFVPKGRAGRFPAALTQPYSTARRRSLGVNASLPRVPARDAYNPERFFWQRYAAHWNLIRAFHFEYPFHQYGAYGMRLLSTRFKFQWPAMKMSRTKTDPRASPKASPKARSKRRQVIASPKDFAQGIKYVKKLSADVRKKHIPVVCPRTSWDRSRADKSATAFLLKLTGKDSIEKKKLPIFRGDKIVRDGVLAAARRCPQVAGVRRGVEGSQACCEEVTKLKHEIEALCAKDKDTSKRSKRH